MREDRHQIVKIDAALCGLRIFLIDRFDAQQDYQVNVRAEMQISELHVKLDEARNVDWRAVIALERQQLEVLERIERALSERGQS